LFLEIRALPPKQSGFAPFKYIQTQYRRILDWYRQRTSSDQIRLQTIQLWLDENDARLLFWSLPQKLKILIIAAE